jgi:hypothetical protein
VLNAFLYHGIGEILESLDREFAAVGATALGKNAAG